MKDLNADVTHIGLLIEMWLLNIKLPKQAYFDNFLLILFLYSSLIWM